MSTRTRIILICIGIFIVTLVLIVTTIRWALSVELIQSPITLEFRRAIIYRKELKDYKFQMMKKKAQEGIDMIDGFYAEYPEQVTPSPTPTPKAEKKVEAEVTSNIQSFPKYLTDVGAGNRDKALSWIKNKYSGDDIVAFDNILKKESGYRADALNEIGAGGICQAYPHTKMPCDLTDEDFMCQLEWCDQYIVNRYGSPTNAYQFHIINNWF